ncbi:MAG: glycoside hydrolase family 2 TIM barrel-domain containing protein, partial [bacterium]
ISPGIHFCVLIWFQTILYFTGNALAQDWVENYLHRPKEESNISDVLQRYYGPTRKLIILNGLWQAKKQGEEIWKPVWVPGAYDFEGEVEFKHSFNLDSTFAGYAFKLIAFGINNRCTVFINKEYQSGHVAGHSSFTLELDNATLTIGGENEIQILVDNTLLPRNSLPLKHNPRMSYNYGGIFRDIFIVAVPKIYVDDLKVNQVFTEDFKQCRLDVKSLIRNKSGIFQNDNPEINLHLELWDIKSNALMARSTSTPLQLDRVDLQQAVTLNIKNMELWSPANPNLFELRAYLTQKQEILDEMKLRLGFSDFKTIGNKFLLNGQPFTLNGIDWYEDYPEVGPTAGWNAIKEEVLRIKQLGANAVRVVATPPHPFFLDICDELGLLVLQEIPLTLIPDQRFEESGFVELATNYYRDVLKSAAHHASMAAWGLGSDLQYSKTNTQNFLKALKTIIQSNSSRPTYLVMRNFTKTTGFKGRDFVIFEGYGKEPNDLFTLIRRHLSVYSGKAFIFSYGCPIYSEGKISSMPVDFSHYQHSKSLKIVAPLIAAQEMHAAKLQQALSNMELIEKTAGVFVHTFADWRGRQPNIIFGANENPFINRMGLVNKFRQKRIAYEIVQSEFKKNQPIQIPAHAHQIQNPVVYPIFGTALILLFLFNFNRSRRLRGNLRRIFVYPHGFYTELKDNRKISLWHTFLLSFITCTVMSIILSSIAFNFRKDLIFNEIFNLFIGSNSIKFQLIRLIWRPLFFILTVTLALYLMYFLMIIIFRVTSFVLDQSLPIGQFFTLVFWASANFVWLLPITPIYFRILNHTNWAVPAILLLVVFIMWSGARMLRGVQVVFMLNLVQAIFLFFILFVLIFGGIGWYYDSKYALFDYFPLYWSFILPH